MGKKDTGKMKKMRTLLIFFAVCAAALTSCGGDKSQRDYASMITGTYIGTVTTGSGTTAGSSEIVRRSDTRIDMNIIAGSHSLSIPAVTVSRVADNIYDLSFTLSGNSLDGRVEGNILTYTLSSGELNGTFTGTK
ncbi:MAG: hypothetical protein WCD55_10445 [Bacteroidales bacterium]